MAEQGDIFFNDQWATISERFQHFHSENPHVLTELVRICRRVKANGYDRWSIDAAYQVLRYNRMIRTRGDAFKLNDHYRALYARKIMAECPDLAGFFEIRRRKAG